MIACGRRVAVALLALCLYGADAGAADLAAGPLPATGGVLGDLHVARDEVDLEFGDVRASARLTRVGIAWFERFGDLALGLLGGYARTDLQGEAVTAGIDFSGGYAGIAARSILPLGRRFGFGLGMRFLYHRMDGEGDGQSVDLEWTQGEATATLHAGVTPRLSVYAGPMYSLIRVSRMARGPVRGTAGFDGVETGGVVGGLVLELEPGGYIGLEARGGPGDGVALSFMRHF